MPPDEWTDAEHVNRYLDRADEFPRRAEGEGVLLDHVPRDVRYVLDLGTGDGRLLNLLQRDRPHLRGTGLDFSEPCSIQRTSVSPGMSESSSFSTT